MAHAVRVYVPDVLEPVEPRLFMQLGDDLQLTRVHHLRGEGGGGGGSHTTATTQHMCLTHQHEMGWGWVGVNRGGGQELLQS